MRRVYFFLVMMLIAGLVSSCYKTPHQYPVNTKTLVALQNLNREATLEKQQKKISDLRYNALRDTAMSLGARSGLAWEAKQIQHLLAHNREFLDQIFNFNPLILPHNVLPPVLTEGRNTINMDNDTTLRIADHVYKIEQQARFATTPPNWREYLWMDYADPELPDSTLLPRTQQEMHIWKIYVTKGWEEGIRQGEQIFASSINKITEDFVGMLLYRKLLAQNIVSPPYVAKTDLGVIGGGDEMSVNDQVLRITALPQLQADTKNWQPVVAR